MTRPSWAPEEIDINVPSAARAYDYVLGGTHNFEVDRQLARKLADTTPDLAVHARANRAFLQRAVRYLAGEGIRQFLDIGSGIPATGNTHEIAQLQFPDSRVVYVDIDPVAVAHSRSILSETKGCTIVKEDVRHLDRLLADPELNALLDLEQPVAVLLLALLHAIPDADEPAAILARLHERLAPGSYLIISHATFDERTAEARALENLSKNSPTALHMRSREQIGALFAGFELVEPGLTWVSSWRPEPGAPGDRSDFLLGGVGRKNG